MGYIGRRDHERYFYLLIDKARHLPLDYALLDRIERNIAEAEGRLAPAKCLRATPMLADMVALAGVEWQ